MQGDEGKACSAGKSGWGRWPAIPASAGASASPAPVKDYANFARDIVPSGNFGSIPTPSTQAKIERQAVMYNALTPLFSHVTQADVISDFKAETLNVKDAPGPVTKETVPHAGSRSTATSTTSPTSTPRPTVT